MALPSSFGRLSILLGPYYTFAGDLAGGSVTLIPDDKAWLKVIDVDATVVPGPLTATVSGGYGLMQNVPLSDDPDVFPTFPYTIVEVIAGKTRTTSGITIGRALLTLPQPVNLADILHPDDNGLPTAPANTVLPVIACTPQVGQVLAVSTGTWTGTAPISYTYAWRAVGSNTVLGAGASYTLTSSEVGKAITCTVTAVNSVGQSSATANPTSAVTSPGSNQAVNSFGTGNYGTAVYTAASN